MTRTLAPATEGAARTAAAERPELQGRHRRSAGGTSDGQTAVVPAGRVDRPRRTTLTFSGDDGRRSRTLRPKAATYKARLPHRSDVGRLLGRLAETCAVFY